jgi:DNA-binding LacI/PurR family transcriptional regulator
MGYWSSPPPELVLDPFFRMVSQPGFEIGKQAANILIQLLTSEDELPFREIILPTEIAINSSTAPI